LASYLTMSAKSGVAAVCIPNAIDVFSIALSHCQGACVSLRRAWARRCGVQ
jgi:hypothetical protein